MLRERLRVYPRIVSGGCANQLIERHLVGPGKWQQQFQRRPALARLQP
jgi:hypothetical protein